MNENKPFDNRWILKAKFSQLKKMQTMSDQMKGLPHPPCFKEAKGSSNIIQLPDIDENILCNNSLFQAILQRESIRSFSEGSISMEELSFLLWSTQGVRKPSAKPYIFFRTVPSAGCRHAFETYIAAHHIDGLKQGVYRYMPKEHALEHCFEDEVSKSALKDIALGQDFVGNCAVSFFWSCLPYRMEWRYHMESVKLILLDAGHVAQNLMLAAVSIHGGSCAIGAYDQELADQYLKIDGEDEFVVYMAAVGKLLNK